MNDSAAIVSAIEVLSKNVNDLRTDTQDLRKSNDAGHQNIYKILNGNGQTGLVTRVDRNTGFRKGAIKTILWLMTPLYVAIIGLVIKIIFNG